MSQPGRLRAAVKTELETELEGGTDIEVTRQDDGGAIFDFKIFDLN